MIKLFSNKNIKALDIILGLLILSYFLFVFFKYSINIPVNDDYDVINNFNNILNAETFYEKIELFYLQHNEHRILYDKLWFYISYLFNPDGLNFNFLSFIGNASLVAILIFYYNKLQYLKQYLIIFPLSVLLLNLTFWENLTFSMAALANLTFLFFALVSLNYLTKEENNNRNLFLTIIFFFLSIMTQGGGIFLFPIGLIILFIKKDKVYFLKYFALSTIVIVFYFIDYTKHPSPKLSDIFSNSFEHFKFYLSFLGSAIANYHFFPDNSEQAFVRSVVLGSILTFFYLLIIIRKYYKKNLFNFSVMTLLILISIVTSITRLNQGIYSSYSSRYRLISIIFLITVFVYLLEYSKSKNINPKYVNVFIIAFSSIYLFTYNFNSTNESLMEFRKKSSLFGVLNFFSSDNSKLNTINTNFSAGVLNKSYQMESFILNEEMINNYYKFASKEQVIENDISLSISSNIEKLVKLKDSYYIEGFAFINNFDTKTQKVYLKLINNGNEVCYLTTKEARPGLSDYFKVKDVDLAGFSVRIRNEDMLSGKNEIVLLIVNQNKVRSFKTDKEIIK